jgi:hypothetical protein
MEKDDSKTPPAGHSNSLTGQGLTDLLKLVEDKCTNRDIRAILKRAKTGGADVRVSEATKALVVHKNLRAAIEKRLIAEREVYDVLCGAEENGGQHIFYYTLTDPGHFNKYADGEKVGTRLFGANWNKTQKFPQFHLQPKGVIWSDFRVENRPGATSSNWVAKVYSGLETRKFIEEKKESQSRVIRIYEITLNREIYLVKWHGFGLLEVRVPRQSSSKEVTKTEEDFWTMLAPGMSRADFTSWDLSPASSKIVSTRSSNKKLYRLGNTRALGKTLATAYFCPHSSDDDLCDDPAHDKSVSEYKSFKEVVVYWLPQTNTDAIEADSELRVVIGKLAKNEILISAKATAAEVDYVTYRLREFSK